MTPSDLTANDPVLSEGRLSRVSLRVPRTTKRAIEDTVADLNGRHGLNTSQTELVELFLTDGLMSDPDELATHLRSWRAAAHEVRSNPAIAVRPLPG